MERGDGVALSSCLSLHFGILPMAVIMYKAKLVKSEKMFLEEKIYKVSSTINLCLLAFLLPSCFNEATSIIVLLF